MVIPISEEWTSGEAKMTCFEGVAGHPVFWFVIVISAAAALVLLWVLKFQRFNGKTDYTLTFVATIWTLMMVGLEAASSTFSCQYQWAVMAWIGHALLPIAWCYFIFAYVGHAAWLEKRSVRAAQVIIPIAIFAFASTNPWHHLVYTEASAIPLGEGHIRYVHGAGFYLVIAVLYSFVAATLFCLASAFTKENRTAWPLLGLLVAITVTPLATNAAYVVFGFTVFGLDPTAFMFTLGTLGFTWILATNKTLDMAFAGQSVLANTMSEPVIMIDRHRKIVLKNAAAKSVAFRQSSATFLSDISAHIETLSALETIPHLNINHRIYEPRIREIENPLDPSDAILGWSITFVDITDRIGISGALEDALKRADEANRAKDEFISVVSHELRTPLTSLIGGLALARSGRLGDVADPVQSVLDIAHRNGIRLSRLVDNILLAQKIDINALNLDNRPVDLGQLLEESFKENEMFASERGVRLVLGDVVRAPLITCDAFAMRQIIDNLVSNAIKFSFENCTVQGTFKILNGKAQLAVTNSGQGIPEGMDGQVFGRFEQIENGAQGSTQGSGLGLHISKKLAGQMSGDIFYESEMGVSTTFYVTFPVVAQQQVERQLIAS